MIFNNEADYYVGTDLLRAPNQMMESFTQNKDATDILFII